MYTWSPLEVAPLVGWSQWGNIASSLRNEEETAEKMTKDYYWISAEDYICMFIKS